MSDADKELMDIIKEEAIGESNLGPELFVNKLMTCAYERKGLDYEERKKHDGPLTRKEVVEFCIPLLAEMFKSEEEEGQ